MSTEVEPADNPEIILGTYKQMQSECQQMFAKIQELSFDRDEHRLALETLEKLEPERKAFRLVGGVLVEKTVGEVAPLVSNTFDGVLLSFILTRLIYLTLIILCSQIFSVQIKQVLETLQSNLKVKETEKKAYKGISK